MIWPGDVNGTELVARVSNSDRRSVQSDTPFTGEHAALRAPPTTTPTQWEKQNVPHHARHGAHGLGSYAR
jgi:hypothetical protein